MMFQPITKFIRLIDETLLPKLPRKVDKDGVREELATRLEEVEDSVSDLKGSLDELQELMGIDLTYIDETLDDLVDKYDLKSYKARGGQLDHLIDKDLNTGYEKESIKEFNTVAIVDDKCTTLLKNEGEDVLHLPEHMYQGYIWVTDRTEDEAKKFLQKLIGDLEQTK